MSNAIITSKIFELIENIIIEISKFSLSQKLPTVYIEYLCARVTERFLITINNSEHYALCKCFFGVSC